jgi:hypothetical protein
MFFNDLCSSFHDPEAIFSRWKRVSLSFLCGFHIRESCFAWWNIGLCLRSALSDDMVFSFTFGGNAIQSVDPHVKVEFVNATDNKVGSLLSSATVQFDVADKPITGIFLSFELNNLTKSRITPVV